MCSTNEFSACVYFIPSSCPSIHEEDITEHSFSISLNLDFLANWKISLFPEMLQEISYTLKNSESLMPSLASVKNSRSQCEPQRALAFNLIHFSLQCGLHARTLDSFTFLSAHSVFLYCDTGPRVAGFTLLTAGHTPSNKSHTLMS